MNRFRIIPPLAMVLVSSCSWLGSPTEIFAVEPGPGVGAEAEALSTQITDDLESSYVPGSANLRAWVETPEARIQIMTFQMVGDEETSYDCTGRFGDDQTGWVCNRIDPELPPLDLSPVTGGASGNHYEAVLRASEQVIRVEAVTADGNQFTLTPANGIIYARWDVRRGPMTVTAYDESGFIIGDEIVGATSKSPS